MLSEGNAVHPVAQVHTVQSKSFDYDGSKNPNHYRNKTHTCCHSKCHYPEAGVVALKSLADASSEDVCHEHIQNTEAEDYRCVSNKISLHTISMNDSDIDAMMVCDTLKQCLHALIPFGLVLRTEVEVHIGPPYRYIFGGDSVEAQMPSIRYFCQV